jgi:hypothetical protein
MNRDLLIWMAGFFDGEGCVSIGRAVHAITHGKRRTSTSYCLQVIVGQRERAPLEHFLSAFGGVVYPFRRKGMEYYRWVIASHKAAAALVQLLPYLQIKRAVAEVAIRFQEDMSVGNNMYGRRGYPEHIRQARVVFYEQAKKLNARNRPDMNAPAYEGPRALSAAKAVNQE